MEIIAFLLALATVLWLIDRRERKARWLGVSAPVPCWHCEDDVVHVIEPPLGYVHVSTGKAEGKGGPYSEPHLAYPFLFRTMEEYEAKYDAAVKAAKKDEVLSIRKGGVHPR